MKQFIFAALALLLVAGFGFAAAPVEGGADYRIGLAFDVGGKGDQSFNDSAYAGLAMIAEEYDGFIADDPDGVDFGSAVEMKYLEPKAGGQDRELLVRTLAEDGYGIIYAVGFAHTDSVTKVSADFPDTHFVLIDGFIPDLTADSNVTCVAFAEHEGSFLVGALAGLLLADTAPDAPIGFIGGMDIPLIHKFEAGYFAGAMYANPALRDPQKLYGQYIGQDPSAFADPQGGEAIAENFFNRGAEIVYHAAGSSGSGLFKAAADAGKWAIGVDSDQGLILASSDSADENALAENVATSMLKRVDISVFITGQDYLDDGEIDGGYLSFGLVDGGVDIAINEFNEGLMAPYIDEINELKQMVVDGEISVPDHDDQLVDWATSNF